MPTIHGFTRGRYNGRYYANNLGHVVKVNEDGTHTAMGPKATFVANLIVSAFIMAGWYYGYKTGKVEFDIESYNKGFNDGLHDALADPTAKRNEWDRP